MGGAEPSLPLWLQWLGLVATLVGAAFSMWAALSAKSARKQAVLARQAAISLGRVTQLGDILSDMQELQTLITRGDFDGIAPKATHLRGRIVRFKEEAYSELSDDVMEHLDAARDQLREIEKASSVGAALPATRKGRIQVAYGHAMEHLNSVFAFQRRAVQGERT